MKKVATWTAIAIAAMIATEAACAAPRHRVRTLESRPATVGGGYYDGDYQFNVDRNDRASSPYY